MKIITKQLTLILIFLNGIFISSQAQISQGGKPHSFLPPKNVSLQSIIVNDVQIPDMEQVKRMDGDDEKNGTLRKIGRTVNVNYSMQNSGTWETYPDGSKIWRLKLKMNAAKAILVYYDDFYLPQGSELFLYNENKRQILGAYTSQNNPESHTFANELVEGETVTLDYFQPSGVQTQAIISINGLGYIYRDYTARFDYVEKAGEFGSSGACEVNVNCSEGTNFQNQKRSVVRILVTEPTGQGWCSGTLVNNTAQNCSPYILTADHCSGNGASTTTNLTQWVFYFNYESPSCSDPASEGTLATKTITGCTLKARGGANGTIGSTSDFYLVLMNSSPPQTWNPYYAGWNRGAAASPSGVGIHHPAGDIKKISTYTSTLTSSNWSGGTIAGTHWQVIWAATANGTGVTEGGSSGSPIFDNNGRVVGQLSGGSSLCTSLTSPDVYGKFAYDWASNTLPTTNNKLQPWLDPSSTGVTVLDGTNAPCGLPAPVADFSANNLVPCIGSTVTFTDLSSGTPTSWLWTFNPTSVSYVGGTSSTSQNPQVQFTSVGPYSVTLKAINSIGNNTITKTNYITPSSTAGTLPFVENFEGATFPPTGWSITNADAPSIVWGTAGAKGLERRSASGNTGSTSGCAGIECFNYTDSTQVDNLISKSISLSGASNAKMTFKRAYKYYNSATNPGNYHDELRIYVSSDCGLTYGSAIYYKKGVQLASNGTINTSFTPSVAADWKMDTVSLAAYSGQNIIVKFEVADRWGNNLYIDDVNITNSTSPVASVSIISNDADNIICAASSVTFTATPTNGGTTPVYQWKVNGTNVGTNSPTYTTTALTNGQIVTCVMTSNLAGVIGSPATSNGITMTVNAIPATPTAGSNTPVCTGSTINLTTPTTTGTYSWTGPGAFTSTLQNPTRTGATTAMAGTYSVTVTSAGCTSVAGITTLVVNATPVMTVVSNTSVCTGASVSSSSFTSTPAGATFAWTNSTTAIGLAASGTGNLPAFTATNAGSSPIVATITVTPSLNGCVGSATSFSITINPRPTSTYTQSANQCLTGNSFSFTNTGGTGTYSWAFAGGTPGTSSVNNPTGVTFATAGSHTITHIVTSSAGCISATTTSTVTIFASPTALATTTSVSACGASNGTINIGAVTGGTAPYTYSVNASAYTSTTSYTGFAAGSYMVIVKDANGCTFSKSVMITNSSGPTALAVTTGNSTCGNSNGTINVGTVTGGLAPFTYSINASAYTTTTSYTGFASGSYTVMVKDANGCIFTTSAVVNNTLGPAALAVTTVNSTCNASNGAINIGAVTGGTFPYTYSVNASAYTSTTSYSGFIAGTYNVTVKDANGCIFTTSATVINTGTTPSTPTISQAGNILTSSSATGNQWYLNGAIISGATGQNYTVIANGNYSVVVTSNGCSSMASAPVNIMNVGIEETGNPYVLSIYPNPNDGNFNVSFTSPERSTYTLELINALGQLIYKDVLTDFTGTYTKKLNVTEYGKGVYTISLTNSKNETVKKIVVY